MGPNKNGISKFEQSGDPFQFRCSVFLLVLNKGAAPSVSDLQLLVHLFIFKDVESARPDISCEKPQAFQQSKTI